MVLLGDAHSVTGLKKNAKEENLTWLIYQIILPPH